MDYSDTILESYDKEFEIDVTQNILNLHEVTFRHPYTQFKWVNRLRKHQKNVIDLNREIEDMGRRMSEETKKMYPKLSEVKIKTCISDSNEIKKVKRKIEEEKLIVGHLEQYLKILQQMGYNFKTSTDHIKLDLTME